MADFITLAGLVVGLGAVTVIDTLGFLGRKSSYWTETTIRSHKVTKPLIWLGTILLALGYFLTDSTSSLQWLLLILLVLNGLFLSFYISPLLISREKRGLSQELLPANIIGYIMVSFLVSFSGWWLSVWLLSQK